MLGRDLGRRIDRARTVGDELQRKAFGERDAIEVTEGGVTHRGRTGNHHPLHPLLPRRLQHLCHAHDVDVETLQRVLADCSRQQRRRVDELQSRYGLGLSPLREALLRLATEGLVVAEGQRGFTVAPVSLAELVDLTRTRQHIESIALSEAMERGDTAWEAGILYHLLSRAPLPANPSDTEATVNWELRHRAFHDALVAACDSPWLMRFRSQLVDHSERHRRARLFNAASTKDVAHNSDAEHRAIMEAVLARDAQKACELVRNHLQRTATAVAQALRPEGKQRSANPKAARVAAKLQS